MNGKIYIDAVPNLKDQWNTIKEFQLKVNRFPNAELQKDWNQYGESIFIYEELDTKEVEEGSEPRKLIKQMKKEWS